MPNHQLSSYLYRAQDVLWRFLMKNKWNWGILIAVVIILIASIAIYINYETHRIKKITVVHEYYKPYEYQVNGNTSGIDKEMLSGAAAILNIEVEYKQFSWAECMDMIKAGKADAIFSLSKANERSDFICFCEEPINAEENILFVKKGSAINYDGNLNSLMKYKLGVEKDYDYGENFNSATHLNKDISRNLDEIIQKVLDGKVDAGVYDKLVLIDRLVDKNMYDKIDIVKEPINTTFLYVGFSKQLSGDKYKILARDFAKAIAQYRKTPRYISLLKRYGLIPKYAN